MNVEIKSNLIDEIVIDYGFIKGSNKIVFIKAGQDCSMYGYKDKYLRIAKRINEKYDYTIICSSNPFNGINPLDNAMEVIGDYCKKRKYN